MKTLFKITILILIMTLVSSIAFGKDKKKEKETEPIKLTKSIEAVGQAAVVGGDLARARDIAILDAQVKALEEVCGAFISAETVGKSFIEVEEKISKNTKGYISEYKVIDGSEQIKDIEGSKLLSISIRAEINVNQVYDALKDLQGVYEKIGKPKFYLMIKSLSDGNHTKHNKIIEGVIGDYFREMGFEVVDKDVLGLKDGGYYQDYNFLKKYNVKMVVLIDVTTKTKKDNTGSKLGGIAGAFGINTKGIEKGLDGSKSNTELTMKFVDLDSAEAYYTTNIESSSQNVDLFGLNSKDSDEMSNDGLKKAFKDFFDKKGNELRSILFNQWVDVANKNTFIITFNNVKNSDIKKIKDQISEKDRFVKSIDSGKFSKGSGTITVSTKSNSDQIVEIIEGITYDDKKFEISEIDEDGKIVVDCIE